MLVRDLSHCANAIYTLAAVEGIEPSFPEEGKGWWNAFQAGCYNLGGRTVVAFRGTARAGDVAADAAFVTGMNSGYFALAEEYVASLGNVPNIILTGHSLGGSIAQVVANRMNLPMVTFNAPGVAVVASRNMLTTNPVLGAVRAGGMVASAVVRPGQAWRDVKATFRAVRGLNVRLFFDPFSAYGTKYGQVRIIMTAPMLPLAAHSMDTMVDVLKTHPVGELPVTY